MFSFKKVFIVILLLSLSITLLGFLSLDRIAFAQTAPDTAAMNYSQVPSNPAPNSVHPVSISACNPTSEIFCDYGDGEPQPCPKQPFNDLLDPDRNGCFRSGSTVTCNVRFPSSGEVEIIGVCNRGGSVQNEDTATGVTKFSVSSTTSGSNNDGQNCSVGSINDKTGQMQLSGLDPNLDYYLRLNAVGNNTLGGQQDFRLFFPPNSTQGSPYIPNTVKDGEYFVTIIGITKGTSLPPESKGGWQDLCYYKEGNETLTLSRGNAITPPPGSGDSCPTPGGPSLQAEPNRSWYWADDPIVLTGNIFNCSSNILFDIFANNSTGETVGNIPGTQDIPVANNQLRVSLTPLAKGTWEFNAHRNGINETIFSDNLVLKIINDKPELEGVPGSLPPGDQAEFTITSCPRPAEVRVNGERINEDAEVTRADDTTVGVLIPGSFFQEEGEYEISATCAGRPSDAKTITVKAGNESEPIICPVCPNDPSNPDNYYPYYTKYSGKCCKLQGCRMPAGANVDDYITDPIKDDPKSICQDNQTCFEGHGCISTPTDPKKPPCADETCSSVAAGDTGLGLSLPTDPAGFIRVLLGILLSISGMVAVALIIRSGYQFMTSRGNPDTIQEARDRLTSAIIGLLFIIFSLVILQVIGVDILHIPGFTN